MKKSSKAALRQDINKRMIFVMAIGLLLAALILIPQADSVSEGIRSIQTVRLPQLILAGVCTFATFIAAAFTLFFIAAKKLVFKRTVLIQAASGFATKLAPAGIGGFALNTRYLINHRHSVAEASSVMALNGLLGFIGHLCVLFLALLFAEETLRQTISLSYSPLAALTIFMLVIVTFFSALIIRKIRQRLKDILGQLKNLLIFFVRQPKRLVYGFVGALSVTILYTTALYFSAASLSVELNFLECLVVFTAGAIGASVTPTPGGIGGAEAALTAALVAVGVESRMALSVAITFRLVTYWLPILPGLLFFNIALRRRYI